MSVKRGGEKGIWVGIVKLHLLYPEIDGIAMLKGLIPFILHLGPLSNKGTLGKVCKSYHAIAKNNNLSIKITSDTLIGVSPHALFIDVLESSFRRGHEFEVVDVQKSTPQNHAYINCGSYPSPSQEDSKSSNLHTSRGLGGPSKERSLPHPGSKGKERCSHPYPLHSYLNAY